MDNKRFELNKNLAQMLRRKLLGFKAPHRAPRHYIFHYRIYCSIFPFGPTRPLFLHHIKSNATAQVGTILLSGYLCVTINGAYALQRVR